MKPAADGTHKGCRYIRHGYVFVAAALVAAKAFVAAPLVGAKTFDSQDNSQNTTRA
jgi:hypothetical protein